MMRRAAPARVAGRGVEVQRAEYRVGFAEVGEEFLEHLVVEMVNGGDGGDDDADVLFEEGPEAHGDVVPWGIA